MDQRRGTTLLSSPGGPAVEFWEMHLCSHSKCLFSDQGNIHEFMLMEIKRLLVRIGRRYGVVALWDDTIVFIGILGAFSTGQSVMVKPQQVETVNRTRYYLGI